MAGYNADEVKCANDYPNLGAEYERSRTLAEGFLSAWSEDDAEALGKEILTPVMDAVHEKIWDSFREYILSDTENNVAGHMRDMVEKSVRALIGGAEWANVKYIKPDTIDAQKVRKTLAKMYSDQIKDARISDLEIEVSDLKRSLEFYGRR